MTNVPRSEYPRPQFLREEWLCLNGEWQFEIDQGDSGLERGLLERELSDKIIVPFCPESKLSGIENLDFLDAVWYRRTVRSPLRGAGSACCCTSRPSTTTPPCGSTASKSDVTAAASRPSPAIWATCGGETLTIVVRARDGHTAPQPRGKQAREHGPSGAIYVRTTGIWQTVWMEPVPEIASAPPAHHARCRQQPDPPGAADLQQPARRTPARRPQRRTGRSRHAPNARPMWISPRGSTSPFPPSAGGCGRSTTRTSTICELSWWTRNGSVVDSAAQLRRSAQRHHRRQGHQDQRRGRLPAAGARPGLLPGRHHDRAQRRGPDAATSS